MKTQKERPSLKQKVDGGMQSKVENCLNRDAHKKSDMKQNHDVHGEMKSNSHLDYGKK